MPLSPPAERERLHTRRYEFGGFRRKDGLWDIEGQLIDTKTYAFSNQYRGEIQSGEFAREWLDESRAGSPNLLSTRRAEQDQLLEQVGAQLRSMMPFLVPKTPPAM